MRYENHVCDSKGNVLSRGDYVRINGGTSIGSVKHVYHDSPRVGVVWEGGSKGPIAARHLLRVEPEEMI